MVRSLLIVAFVGCTPFDAPTNTTRPATDGGGRDASSRDAGATAATDGGVPEGCESRLWNAPVQVPVSVDSVSSFRPFTANLAYLATASDQLSEIDLLPSGDPTGQPRTVGFAAQGVTMRNHPFVYDQGKALVFQARNSATTNAELWWTKRIDLNAPWEEASRLVLSGAAVDTLEPWVAGSSVYFGNGGGSTKNIAVATTVNGVYGNAEEIAALVSPGEDGFPVVTNDERTLFYAGQRDRSNLDIYVSTRASTSEAWGPPAKVGALSTDDQDDRPSWISSDGCTMLLTRKAGTGFILMRAHR